MSLFLAVMDLCLDEHSISATFSFVSAFRRWGVTPEVGFYREGLSMGLAGEGGGDWCSGCGSSRRSGRDVVVVVRVHPMLGHRSENTDHLWQLILIITMKTTSFIFFIGFDSKYLFYFILTF